MEDLPNILVRKTALSLPFTEITRLCRTNTKFNKAICYYQQFWHDKLVLDYGITEKFSEELNWKKIYIYYTLFRLIGLGSNERGQLGLGQITEINELTEIPTVAVKDMACGLSHTVIIDVDGNLWGTGNNYNGQLGIDTGGPIGQEVKNLIKLTHNLGFTQIACGFDHTLALSSDNRIWVTGSNGMGQIGLNLTDEVNQFTELKGHRAKQIACGGEHSTFIDLNGNLYTSGYNYYGYLGRDGNNKIPGKVSIPIPVIQVSCGVNHTACVDANNDIWAFGANNHGQLGMYEPIAKYPKRISNHKTKFISCGLKHTAFIDLEDYVWTFGNNKYGQLGLQRIELSYHPMKVTDVYDEGQIIKRDFRVKEVHCGNGITLFIDFENNLWVTGKNEKLNINSKAPVMIPRIKASKVATGEDYLLIKGYFK